MATATGTITAGGQTVSLTNIRDSKITILIVGPTYAGVEIIFEASFNGADFFPIGLESSEKGIIISTTGLISNSNFSFFKNDIARDINTFRVRALSHTSGTANITIKSTKIIEEPAALEELIYGQTLVGTAGIAVILLSASQDTNTLTISAKEANVGNIFIGDSSVNASTGYILSPGATLSIDHNHALDNIYIDAANNGDGVSYIGSIVVE